MKTKMKKAKQRRGKTTDVLKSINSISVKKILFKLILQLSLAGLNNLFDSLPISINQNTLIPCCFLGTKINLLSITYYEVN